MDTHAFFFFGIYLLWLLNATPTVSEETCDEVQSLVFDLFANLGATGTILVI
jgi:GTP-binding protein